MLSGYCNGGWLKTEKRKFWNKQKFRTFVVGLGMKSYGRQDVGGWSRLLTYDSMTPNNSKIAKEDVSFASNLSFVLLTHKCNYNEIHLFDSKWLSIFGDYSNDFVLF